MPSYLPRGAALTILGVLACAACRPSDVLTVPPPSGALSDGALESQEGAESAFNGAKGQLFNGLDGTWNIGLLTWSGLLTDEFTFSGFDFYPSGANTDARITTIGTTEVRGFSENGDAPWQALLQARSGLLLAIPLLEKYEPTSNRALIGEAYALVGYAELLIAESYCAGTPLDVVTSGSGVQYGTPLTTDSLLGTAITHFDSAVAEANGDPTTSGLADVGLGRALMDRGQYSAAATAVANVPGSFVYNVTLQPNANSAPYTPTVYGGGISSPNLRLLNVADREGGNGLDFISAQDPRLMLDSSLQTIDGLEGTAVPGLWYLPEKFEADPADIPLATGIEAQLIKAENDLSSDPALWLDDLNAMRTGGCTGATDATCSIGTARVTGQANGLLPLVDPGSDSGRVSLMFRERAFWLFGTGTRLGDLRRLIRQYGRVQSTVYPTGSYVNGNNPNLPIPIPNYGTDVDMTLPTPIGLGQAGATITNPNYKGCLTSTNTA